MDYFSLTDPQVKLYKEKNGTYQFIDKTEMIQDNLNPNFTKTFILDYYFEVKQKLKFEIIDIDGPNQTEFVGEVFTTLGEIVGSKNQTAIFDISCKGKKTGKLVIKCEKVARNSSSLFLQFAGNDLKNVEGFFGKSNPVLKLSRAAGDSGFVVVYETEVVKKNLNPVWKGFEIKIQKLCNGDYYRPIKVEVFSRASYKDTLIGESQFTINELKDQEVRSFNLQNPAKGGKRGTLRLSQFSIVEKPEFLDYLRGGVQLNVVLAVDFTGSNGDPSFPTSLHALKYDNTLNEYQKAIHGVCGILLDYDYDQKIPCFGFGGKPKFPQLYSTTVQHCFPMTGFPQNPWCLGLEGILQSYAHALQNVDLSGPTLFAPILQQAMSLAQANKNNGSQEYTILLIITDGEIHDMEPSINCLIKAANLPLSVIIVGVGNADFTNMEILDGDDGLSNSNGVKAERDLVQFVPFRNFGGNHEELARHVLEEVPNQLVEYMMRVGIKPKPAQQVDINAVFNRTQTLTDVTVEVKQPYGANVSMPHIYDNVSPFGLQQQQTITASQLIKTGTIGPEPTTNVQLNFEDPNKQYRGGNTMGTMGPGPFSGGF